MEIRFDSTKEDADLIDKIMERAMRFSIEHGIDYTRTDCMMDLTACHLNGTPLDLPKLLAVEDGTFGHDVFGIRRHIDRGTGKLLHCFLPRCAQKEAETAL